MSKFNVEINTKWCKACGICFAVCPKGVLTEDREGKAQATNQDSCIGCLNCVLHCPDFVIDVKEAQK